MSILEHEFDAWLKSDDEAKQYVGSLDIVDILNPNESLMGGRTKSSVIFPRDDAGGLSRKYVLRIPSVS